MGGGGENGKENRTVRKVVHRVKGRNATLKKNQDSLAKKRTKF